MKANKNPMSSQKQSPLQHGVYALLFGLFLAWFASPACLPPQPIEPTNEPAKQDGSTIDSKPQDTANEPKSEPRPEPRPESKNEPRSEPQPEPQREPVKDGGEPIFEAHQDTGPDQEPLPELPPEPLPELPPLDDICKGKRPCVMTYAGFPSDLKGPAIGTWFISPYSMTADKRGHIYIIDERRKQIYKYTIAAQTIEILAGNSTVGLKDGPALKAWLEKPCSLAVDSKGNVYITEYRGHTVRKIDVNKKVVTTILGNGKAGYANGSPLQASLNYPCGIAVDKQDNLYVGDKTSIRKLTPGGVLSTFAGGATGGTKDGKQGVGQIAHPVELRFDSKGNLIVSSAGGDRIRKVDKQGTITTLRPSSITGFYYDSGKMALDSKDNIYITRGPGILTKVVNGSIVEVKVAGTPKPERLKGIAIDKNDNIYVSEKTWRLYGYIRRVDTKQVAHVVAGSPHEGVVNGKGHTVRFRSPVDIAFDKNRYILYSISDSALVRKIDKDRNVSTYKTVRQTVMGIDTKGQIYYSAKGKIYKILPNGQTVTILGSTEGYKDGPASQALLKWATAFLFYPDGSFLFADRGGYIRKVDKHRNVSTITAFRSGINYIYGMVQDSKGNIYLSENQYAVISKISANTNKLETYAGSTEERGNTDGSLKNARFHFPTGIAIDKYDNLYVGDSWSGLIRKIDTKTGMVSTIAGEVDSHTASRNGVGIDAHFGSIYGVAYDPRRHALFVVDRAFSKIQIILLK